MFRNVLDVSPTLTIDEQHMRVVLDKRAHNPFLLAAGLHREPRQMPWFENKRVVVSSA